MIGFAAPQALWLLLPWLLFCWWFGRRQRLALAWLERHVAARARRLFTVHRPASLTWHLLLVAAMGVLLVVAAAGPGLPGSPPARGGDPVLLLLDASASMWAEDIEFTDAEGEIRRRRLELARAIALQLTALLEDRPFALGSFSGTGVVHLPMIRDRGLVADALATLQAHTVYRNTGSSFTAALDLVSHFLEPDGGRLQVVLLSDGESPYPEEFGPPLEALSQQEVVIHTVAIGSPNGQGRRIFDFRDVVAEVEEPRVLRRFTTRRVDQHLQRIASATRGLFLVGADDSAERLAEEIRRRSSDHVRSRSGDDPRFARDLAWLPLTLFVIAFLIDALAIGRRQPQPPAGFELERIAGAGAAALLLTLTLLAAGCGDSADARHTAHRENERGIQRDLARRHAAARPHYERAAGIGIEPQIPTYNLARSVTLAGDYSEAHDLYQRALEISPELVEAHYNDGLALYRWGEAERDPRGCDLERTHDLWSQAARRFRSARALAGDRSELDRRARANLGALEAQLEELRKLRQSPPPECASNAGGGGGGGGDQNQESDGSPPPSASPPPGGGSGSPPPPEGGGGLSPQDQETIRQALERIAAQSRETGKYHRRTLPEQMHPEGWQSPEAVIWW